MKRRSIALALLSLLALVACQPKPPTVSITPPPMPGQGGAQWWNERVFYEVFVRSFQDSDGDGIGDLSGLIDRLDYLNDGDPQTTDDLGITGLWLMPVAESASYHGYDVIDYYAVERDYGDAATFKRLIDEAHARGIVVIVDLVINHTSSQHGWFVDAASRPQAERRDWYVWSDTRHTYKGPWGQQVWYRWGDAYYYALFWEGMPDLNYRNRAVTDEIRQVTRFWLAEMGVDGFRMDAIRHLIEDGAQQENTPETHRWLREYQDFYKSVNPNAMTVGEVWTNSENVVPYAGEEMDICFEFDLASAILDGVRSGSPFILFSVVAKAARLYPPNQYATFLTNHDQNRAMAQLGGEEDKARVAASIYLTLPGVPFLYYGEEIGMTGQKPDENLRTPMQWTGDPGAGFTTGRPWHRINADYGARNVAAQLADAGSLLNHYKDLIRLRSAFAALRTGTITTLQSDARSVYAYLRHGEREDVLVVHNLGAEANYAPYDLLGHAEGAELEAGDKGAFEGYAPVPTLQPLQSYVFLLRK
jgi:alpha-amylase